MTVPMCPISQRSRKICTCVMCRNFFPIAQMRVPMMKMDSGMTIADDRRHQPVDPDPVRNAGPDDPRIAKLVMFVPKRLRRKTNVPSERLARKKSSAPPPAPRRNAKMPT